MSFEHWFAAYDADRVLGTRLCESRPGNEDVTVDGVVGKLDVHCPASYLEAVIPKGGRVYVFTMFYPYNRPLFEVIARHRPPDPGDLPRPRVLPSLRCRSSVGDQQAMTPDRTPAFSIEPMTADDWPAVRRIYAEGIATGDATLEREAPDWGHFDRSHPAECRLVARSCR